MVGQDVADSITSTFVPQNLCGENDPVREHMSWVVGLSWEGCEKSSTANDYFINMNMYEGA